MLGWATRLEVIENYLRKCCKQNNQKQIGNDEFGKLFVEQKPVNQEKVIQIEETEHHSHLCKILDCERAFQRRDIVRRKERSAKDNPPTKDMKQEKRMFLSVNQFFHFRKENAKKFDLLLSKPHRTNPNVRNKTKKQPFKVLLPQGLSAKLK